MSLLHDNYFLSNKTDGDQFLVLLILNSEAVNEELVKSLWGIADMKVCADGGANRLYDMGCPLTIGDCCESPTDDEPPPDSNLATTPASSTGTRYLPDFIKGDLDSIRHADVKPFYMAAGVPVLHDPNQDNTDLEKCLDEVLLRLQSKEEGSGSGSGATVLVVGGFDGSFHHDMGNLHVLFRYAGVFHRTLLLGRTVLAELLHGPESAEKGLGEMNNLPLMRHELRLATAAEGPICGLYPVRQPCALVRTQGLKWNIDCALEFGCSISTSNQIIGCDTEACDDTALVVVETSHTLLWTQGYKLGIL